MIHHDPYQELTAGFGVRLRETVDRPDQVLGGAGLIQGFREPDQFWRMTDLDSQTLDRLPMAKIAELMTQLSPEVSRALFDFLRMANPGWEVTALRASGAVDERAKALLDEFMARLKFLYGSENVPINRLFMQCFIRGSFFAELVLDRSGRVPLDLATPDPRWLYFKQRNDPERGAVWVPFQWQNGKQVELDRPTIRYIPVDPLPGSPHGRALATPAFFVCLFAMTLLRDLRRVVSQQGYPRMDIEIAMEKVLAALPPSIKGDEEKTKEWVRGLSAEIKRSYAALQPDDAWVHTDLSKLNKPAGAVSTDALGMIDRLFAVLERMATRALKTTPLLMGLTEGTSEANANRQWELAAASIKAMQHLCEDALEHLLNIALQAQGVQSQVQFRFAELRASELMRDQQTARLQRENAAFAWAMGWISQDQAAFEGAGVEKADAEEPRALPRQFQAGGSSGADLMENPEPGDERRHDLLDLRELPIPTNGKAT